MPVLIVIPARLGSKRLPRKPLQLLAGEPLIARVAERARAFPGIDHLVVATDSSEIASILESRGIDVAMTEPDLASGTDRVATVIARERYQPFDIIVNLQGDEPFLPVEAVTGAITMVNRGDPIGTAAAPLAAEHRDDPSRVKVVLDSCSRALYFSRLAIPAVRDAVDLPDAHWWQHLGIYAYRREPLTRLAALPPSPLELTERLEQLRALEAGIPIGVALLDRPAMPGIDTPEDLATAQSLWPDLVEASS